MEAAIWVTGLRQVSRKIKYFSPYEVYMSSSCQRPFQSLKWSTPEHQKQRPKPYSECLA